MAKRLASCKYDREAVSAAVLLGMTVGGLSATKACEAAGVPIGTFLLWVSEDKELAERYARAREVLIEKMAEDIIEISDAPVGSTDNGATDSGAVQKQKLQVDSRKWLLSKLAPKKYGDKLELSGDQANPIAITEIKRTIVDPTQ